MYRILKIIQLQGVNKTCIWEHKEVMLSKLTSMIHYYLYTAKGLKKDQEVQ